VAVEEEVDVKYGIMDQGLEDGVWVWRLAIPLGF
jgi:hypothetical protein